MTNVVGDANGNAGGPGEPWWARRRWWLVSAVLALALLLTVVGACSWYISSEVGAGALIPDHDEHTFGLEVIEVTAETVRVRAFDDSNAERDSIWALQWRTADDDGWVQVGPPTEVDGDEVVRPLLPFGEPPPVGAEARLDNYALLGTPADLGLSFEAIRYDASLGPAGAWVVCPGRSRWLIAVHGKDGDPGEVMRILPTMTELGFTTFSIGYTNDVDATANEDQRYEYGASEWLDVLAAVQFARRQGAEEIVLLGHSMGGALVAGFLVNSVLAPEMAGAILDAPMLDFRRTVELGLSDAGVPGPLQALPIWLTGMRYDVDWDALDYTGRADEFATPMLIIHGGEDDTTPIEASEELAAARPDLVTFERFEDAHHTGAWNVDPPRYEAAVAAFVEAQLGPTPAVESCAAGG